MRKYYTRACNFYHGATARNLIISKKALALNFRNDIAFDQIEVFQRKKNQITKSNYYSISEIKNLDDYMRPEVEEDIKNITSEKQNILGLKFDTPQIMGALNITPDSFSDGGLFFEKTKAYDQAKLMVDSGATIIDIGGESTRPGSTAVDEKEEWKRIEKTIIKFKNNYPTVPLSLDTRKSYVMSMGIQSRVDIINDVSGLNFDSKSFDLINSKKIPFVLHHMQGTPNTMQNNPIYDDVLLDIFDFFEEKINFFLKHKYKKESIILDPGIGFGKNLDHNLRLISKISIFHSLGCPILIGTSRKRFIEHIVTKFDTPDRTGGTLASVLHGLSQGVQIFRVHNVKEINQGILVYNKILNQIN